LAGIIFIIVGSLVYSFVSSKKEFIVYYTDSSCLNIQSMSTKSKSALIFQTRTLTFKNMERIKLTNLEPVVIIDRDTNSTFNKKDLKVISKDDFSKSVTIAIDQNLKNMKLTKKSDETYLIQLNNNQNNIKYMNSNIPVIL